MQTLPKEIIKAILSYLIEDRARRLARAVCREWEIAINYNDITISCAVTPENADQLRDTLMKRTRPFSLRLEQARLLSAIGGLLDSLSHLTTLYYPSMLPSLEGVTNLRSLSAYSAPAEWLLRQSQLKYLSLSEVTGGRHLLVPDSLSTLQSLSIDYVRADPLLAAVSATKLTSLVHYTSKPYDLAKFTNLKHLTLLGTRVNMEINLPNLEELCISSAMKVSSTRLTSLRVIGASDYLLEILSGLTTVKSLTGGWNQDTEQLSHFTALKHLEEVLITAAPSMKVLRYIQSDNLRQLKLVPKADCIEDIALLSRLTNLRKLDTALVTDADLMVLAPLTKLEYLELTYKSGNNVEVISTMTRLHHLSLTDRTSNIPATLDLQALSRLTHLCVISKCTRLNNVSALRGLALLTLKGNIMDFNQLDAAHLTDLHIANYDDTLWQSLTRMTKLQELAITNLHRDDDVIALSVLTRLTFLSVSHSTNDGRELTRLTSLRFLQYISENTSTAVKEELAKKLVNLEQNTYVVRHRPKK